MDQYITGAVIRQFREKARMTQSELAERLHVSDKTISKWENAKGYPDISLLEPLSRILGISVSELLTGRTASNLNLSSNMLRSKFYICPVCGNSIHSMGEAFICCHGLRLFPAQPEPADQQHMVFIEGVEDEYYVRIEHDMTKQHYVSFIAAISQDRLQMVKLYPEGAPEARFKISGVRRICFYCNRDGLFFTDVHRAIDARPGCEDDSRERRALEQAAKIIFK